MKITDKAIALYKSVKIRKHYHFTEGYAIMNAVERYAQRRKRRLVQRMKQASDPHEATRLAVIIYQQFYKDRHAAHKDGGPGSGNFNHGGRLGEVGGSAPADSGTNGKAKSGTAAAKDCKLKNSTAAAQTAYDKARANEKKITGDMCNIAQDIGAEMYGLEFSVKTASSVEDKIERKKANPKYAEESDAELIQQMGDLVRYTELCDHDSIARTAQATIDQLTQKGYEITEVDNKYTDKQSIQYKGLHINAISPDGQKFELQVHSKASMEVKEKNHVLYEEARKVGTTEERRAELAAQMEANAASLPMPKGIESIRSFKNDSAVVR